MKSELARSRHFNIQIGSNAHEQCVTRCPVCRSVLSPGRLANEITWKISTRDPGITILGSQLTSLADWFGCHIIAKLIFVECSLGAENAEKRASLTHVTGPHQYFSKLPEHKHKISASHPSSQNLQTHFSILTELSLHPRSLHTSIKKIIEKQSFTESQTTLKISTIMFSNIDKIFYNLFMSADRNYTTPS